MSRRDELAEDRAAEYGYREVGGKELRLREWAARKDDKLFAALCARLRTRNWWAKVCAERPEKKAEVLAYRLRWANAKRAADPQPARDYQNARRHAKYRATAPVSTCVQCGATWCRLPGTTHRGVAPRFCGARCDQAWRYANDLGFRERMKANARAQHAKQKARKSGAPC
jgi:hypothetical protein